MTHYILCGENAIENFNNQHWNLLELDILEMQNGELISFDTSEFRNGLHELLESLSGWSQFIELSEQNLTDIERNTTISIYRPEHIKEAIYWSTEDFEYRAIENFNSLKESEPVEFEHLESWEQLYDKTKFAYQLGKMTNNHDASIGITWETIDIYLGNCEMKANQTA